MSSTTLSQNSQNISKSISGPDRIYCLDPHASNYDHAVEEYLCGWTDDWCTEDELELCPECGALWIPGACDYDDI